MTIKKKLLAGFAIIVLSIWIIGIAAIYYTATLRSVFNELNNDIIPGAIAMSAMDATSAKLAHEIVEYILHRESEKKINELSIFLEKIGSAHAYHEVHVGIQEKTAAEDLKKSIIKFNSLAHDIVATGKQGASIEHILKEKGSEMHLALDQLSLRLQAHQAVHIEVLAVSGKKVHELHHNMMRLILIMCISATVFAFGIIAVLEKVIVQPLENLRNATLALSRGELGTQVTVQSTDETGEVSSCFNRMSNDLLISQKELVRAVSYTENIIDSMFDPLIVITPDGNIERINSAAIQLFGCRENKLIGHPVKKFIVIEKSRRMLPTVDLNELAKKEILSDVDAFFLSNDRSRIPVSISGSIMRKKNEGSQMLIITARDMRESRLLAEVNEKNESLTKEIDERKKIEQHLRTARNAANAANLAKSEFLANMSHELKTPMNAVVGFNNLVLESSLTSEQRQYLTIVQNSSQSLLHLIDGVLDFSKIEADQLELQEQRFELRDVMDKVKQLSAVKAEEKKLEFLCEIDPEIQAKLIGDADRLKQVLLNLIDNAVKFTDFGHVHVYAKAAIQNEERITLQFKISDTGAGVPKVIHKQIFECFMQGDGSVTRQHGGIGLGLTISRKLVLLFGGEIWMKSHPGKGSAFYFTACFKKNTKD
ncbi:hypothetical protein KKHLCK_13265 [Candidatus Electrothrix laxa]